MGAGVGVEGLRETVRGLERLGVQAADLRDAFGRIGARVAADATTRAPRGATGRLAGSVRAVRAKNKVAIRAGGRRAPYARYQENGARGRPGRRFLAGAADDAAGYAVDQINAELARIVDTIR